MPNKEELKNIISRCIAEWERTFVERWTPHDITVYVLEEIGHGAFTDAEYDAVYSLV